MGAVDEGSAPDLLAHLHGLLDRAIAPDRFWSWFVRAQAPIELYGSEDDYELAALVELRFAEYSGGYVTAEELLQGLAKDLDDEVGPDWATRPVVA